MASWPSASPARVPVKMESPGRPVGQGDQGIRGWPEPLAERDFLPCA